MKHSFVGSILKRINPAKYVYTFAERSSLISDIGKVVLDKVGKQLQEWKNAGYINIQVAVNIVAQQIHRGLLLNDLDEVLQKYNIQGSDLELEITESALLDNTANVKHYYTR